MPDYLPHFKPGQGIPLTASGTITGGQLVEVSGSGTVAVAGALSTKVVGAAAFDAVNGDRVTVHAGGVQKLVAGAGGVTAGDIVTAGAAGVVLPIGANVFGTKIGIALTTAIATALVDVQMDR